ncbi:MAG TPA: T3SS effector HopA1 family protein [Burkholderiaceae bacterium]
MSAVVDTAPGTEREQAALAALAALVDATRILAPDRFVFAGRPVQLQPGAVQTLYPTPNPLVALLRDQVYEHAYVKPLHEPVPPAPAADPHFPQRLSGANAGRERWHEGWWIEAVEPQGRVVATRHALRRRFGPGEYLLRDGTFAPRPQAPIAVLQPRESHGLQAGFYYAFGEALADEQDEAAQLRFYWNVRAGGVERLLANVSRTLNRFGVPFRFKCLNAAEQYVRLDAAVLYVARRHDRLVRELLDELAAGLDARHLGTATPLFARRLRAGVGQAEDPAGGESFGQHRCRIVAEGLWNAYVEQASTREARLACVVAQFERHGLSLRRPHLNAGSTLEDD